MKPLKLTTNKLFYGKWPYKISTKVSGGNLLKLRGFTYIKNWCSNSLSGQIGYKRNIDKNQLLKYATLLEPFIGDQIKLRAEYDTVNIFVENVDIYNQIASDLKDFVISLTEPNNTEELQTMQDNKKIVFCNNLPKGKFKYKVVMKEAPLNVRENLYKWLCQYHNNKIHLPAGTRKHLAQGRSFWGDCYFYVQDQGTLLMIGLLADGYIRRTEEFVLRSNINTSA